MNHIISWKGNLDNQLIWQGTENQIWATGTNQ